MPITDRPPINWDYIAPAPALLPITEHISPEGLDTCIERRTQIARGGIIRSCDPCAPSAARRDAGWAWDTTINRWVEPFAGSSATVYMGNTNIGAASMPINIDTSPAEPPMPSATDWQVYCSVCDNTFSQSNTIECGDCYEMLCRTCSTNHVHNGPRCYECGYNVLSGEDVWTCERHGSDMCRRHRQYHRTCDSAYSPGDDGAYYGRPPVEGFGREASFALMDEPLVPAPLAQGKRSAALELEVEYDGEQVQATRDTPRLVLPELTGITHDGSLSNGIEVTTPPCRGEALQNLVIETCDILRAGGYVAKPSCGMHTHIDLRDKEGDKKFLSHLFNAFYAVEDILYAMQKNRRDRSHFSIPLRNEFKFFDVYGQNTGDFDYTIYKQPKTYEGKYAMDSEKTRKYASVRYSAFNFHSVYYRGSLEVRLHEGCVSGTDALLWIELLQAIIARVERGHSYNKMQELARMKVTKDKIKKFARYFGLSEQLRDYVDRKITEGQDYNFALTNSIRWGVPVRGRPKGEPREVRRRMPFVGSVVTCYNCREQFTLRASMRRCPNCRFLLTNTWGEANYVRAIPRARSRPVDPGPTTNYAVNVQDIERVLNAFDRNNS